MTWSPTQYDRFRDERSRPFFDLLDLVQRPRLAREGAERSSLPGARVIDLGCGTGELTRVAHERLGAAETVGVDSSAEMLARAPRAPGLRFVCRDLREVLARNEAPFDVILSNAALQWVPDHPALFAEITARLAPASHDDPESGGQLAVQMPANFDHPSHVVAAQVATEAVFASRLAGTERPRPVLAPEDYARLLDRLGYRRQRVRLEVYAHRLASREEVVEWVRGTLLTQYRARLDDPTYEAFLRRYTERLMGVLPDERPFLYPFKRILLWAQR